jgi:hypothetical protein
MNNKRKMEKKKDCHQEHKQQQMLARTWRKRTHRCCRWACKLVQPLWKTVWRVFKKLKVDLPYDPAIPLLGIYPEER